MWIPKPASFGESMDTPGSMEASVKHLNSSGPSANLHWEELWVEQLGSRISFVPLSCLFCLWWFCDCSFKRTALYACMWAFTAKCTCKTDQFLCLKRRSFLAFQMNQKVRYNLRQDIISSFWIDYSLQTILNPIFLIRQSLTCGLEHRWQHHPFIWHHVRHTSWWGYATGYSSFT